MEKNFIRSRQLLGEENHLKLQMAVVFIAGLGAVGSFAAEALVRSGIKHFIINDFDKVEESNLNRQIYALSSTLGDYKVDVAADRMKDINPETEIKKNQVFIKKEVLENLLNPKPDIIVDAIDSVGPKAELLIYAVENGIPIVSSMGAAGRTDPSLVKTGDLSETKGCRLARTIRKSLHKRDIYRGIHCVYSEELAFKKWAAKPETINTSFGERDSLGSMAPITGIFGLMVAHRVIKLILGETFPNP